MRACVQRYRREIYRNTYNEALHCWLGGFWRISCWYTVTECDASTFWRLAYIPERSACVTGRLINVPRDTRGSCVCALVACACVACELLHGGWYAAHIVYTFAYVIRGRVRCHHRASSRSGEASHSRTPRCAHPYTFDRWNSGEARETLATRQRRRKVCFMTMT